MPAKQPTTDLMDDLEASTLDMVTLNQANELPELNELDAAFDADVQQRLIQAQNTAATLNSVVTQDHALVNQLLGQAQMAGAFEDFSRTVRTSKLAYVKENKLYKSLAGGKDPHGAELRGTWSEFCALLNRSVDQVDRDIANLRAFGEEALESMSRMGIGYREMRQYRKLPEDQKQALIEVAKTGDKESFIDLAEEIISKHAFEKAELINDLDEAKADYDSQSELLAKKSKELDDTRLELEKTRRRMALQTPDEVRQQLHTEAAAVIAELDSVIHTKLSKVAETLVAHGETTTSDERSYLSTLVAHVERQLLRIKEQYALDTDDYNQEPDWLQPDALSKADALVAAQLAKLEQ